MIILAIGQIFFSVIVLLYAIRLSRSGNSSLLAIHAVVIVIFLSFGVGIAPFIPIENMTYIGNPNSVPIVRSLTTDLYLRQCLSHWIFLIIVMVGLKLEMSWPPQQRKPAKPVRSPEFWGYSAFAAGILLSVKYYFIGPGLTILTETRLGFLSTSEAVSHRAAGSLEAGIGQGNYMASVAAYIFFPVAAALLTMKKGRTNLFPFILCCLFSILYAFQTRQKAPLLWSVLTFVIIGIISFGSEHKHLLKRIILAGGLIGSLGTILLYVINFGQTLQSSVQGFVYRSFLVPAASEANFFVIFPDSFPYRGVAHVFNIPWGRVAQASSVSIVDIARAATGGEYSANASFLAVAWSAAGYIGILVISLVMVISLMILDRLYGRASKKVFYIALALLPVQVVTLLSDGFSTFFGRGGLIVPLMLVLLTMTPVISLKSRDI